MKNETIKRIRGFTGMKKTFFVTLLLGCAVFMFAQNTQNSGEETVRQGAAAPVRHLTVEEAVTLAIKNNLSLESAGLTLGKTKRQSDLFWNQFLPTVGANGTLTRANSTTTTTYSETLGKPVETKNALPGGTLRAALSVQWTFNTALFQGIKTLKDQYAAGQVGYAKAKIQLEQNIRKIYLQLLLLGENLKVQEANLELADQRVRMASTNYRAGLSAELTMLQSQVNRDNLIPQVDQIRDTIKVQESNLAMLLGLPYDTDFELDSVEIGNFNIPLEVQELISKAASSKPDITQLRSQIVAQKSALRAQQLMKWTPNLSIGWGLAPAYLRDPLKNEWGNGDYWADNSGALSLTLSWSLNPLLPFTTDGNSLRDLKDDLKISELGLAQLIRAEEVNIYTTVFTLSQARDSAAAQQKTADLAQRTFDLTSQAYRAGLQDLLEVENAQNQLNQAKLGVLQKQFDFLSGVIDLEYSLGVPFGTLMAP
jgi:outer membrane protein TolC